MKFKPKPDVTVDQKMDKELLAKDFLLRADKPASFNVNDDDLGNDPKSWKSVIVQKEITAFSFRIPKKDMQQLKYISKQTGISLNALCLMAIQANSRKMLKEIEENI